VKVNRLISALGLLAVLFVSGCGYHVAGKGGAMPPGVESLAIPVFENRTTKPDIESDLTAAFVTEFVTTVNVEGDAGHAMYGVIKRYELQPVSFTKSDINQEYRLTVEMTLTIIDKSSGQVVWRDENISDYEDFTVNINDVTETTEREEAALGKLARDTARLVKERMMEGF
jgi:outer membrane lipopolysaccharide assembly protein LptE/RlpB